MERRSDVAQERLDEVVDVRPDVTHAEVTTTRRVSVREAYRRTYRRIAVSDTAAILLAMLVAYWVRFGFERPTRDFLLLLLGLPFAVLAVFAAFHLFEAYRYTPAEEFRRILLAVSVGVGALMVLSFWSKADLSREWVGLSWAYALTFTLVERRLWHRWIGRKRNEGLLAFPTLIVGTNDEARRLLEAMDRPGFGFSPVGIVATASGPREGIAVVGEIAELRDLIRTTGAECVFVASTAVTPEDMKPIAKAVRLEEIEVRITATLPEVLASRLTVQPLGGITALSLRPARLSGSQVVAKFAFDLIVSCLLLLVLSPLLLVVAIAIATTSPGPILYRQRRVGLRGRPFTMLKFRTMRRDADAQVEALRAARGVSDVMFKLKDDPRVTRVGRWLRRFSIDELPQLFNVVRGDMSLVGPRPPLPEEVTRYEDWHFDRLEAPPGITGLWQVSGRSDLPFDDCVRLDIFYIENWSLAYDLYILAKTVPVLLSSKGAY
jgi:exopolysaccharide biosynthesis polyprenyl glycosylphosphotransferase